MSTFKYCKSSGIFHKGIHKLYEFEFEFDEKSQSYNVSALYFSGHWLYCGAA